jgi:competence protein ComEC
LDQRLADSLDRETVLMEAWVMDLPTRDERSWRMEVEARAVYWRDTPLQKFPRRGVVHWYDSDRHSSPMVIAPGEIWRFEVRLRKPNGTRNPRGFDYEAWMLEKGLGFGGSVQQNKHSIRPQRIGREESFEVWIDQRRDAIRQAIHAALGDHPSRPVITALVVGDQRAISVDEWALFQKTGVSHLMSISGLHVTMLAALIGWLGAGVWRLLCLTPLQVGLWLPVQSVGALSAMFGAVSYALLAGFAIPAERTAWMVCAVCASRVMGIQANPWASLALALIVVLTRDPMAVLAPGFWLSFMAVAFLFSLNNSASTNNASRNDSLTHDSPNYNSRWRKSLALLRQASHAQLAITFGLLPITVMFFQQIVLVGPMANALAIPLVSYLVTPLAMLGVLVDSVLPRPLFLLGAAWGQSLVMLFLQWCASIPLATIDWPSPGVFRTALASVLLMIALSSMLPPRLMRFRHAGWLGLLLLFGNGFDRPAHGDMTVHFIDVGQGSSVLIQTQHHQLLYDTGPSMGESDAGARMVMPTLRGLNLRRMDQLMVSHFDDDHSGGLASVLAMSKVMELRAPEFMEMKPEALLAAGQIPKIECQAGQRWVWDGVEFRVLHPSFDSRFMNAIKANPDRNADSCVLQVRAANGGSVLLTGDIPKAVEESHLFGASLASEVLMAPHHGSKTSSSQALLDAVRPRWVVIQAGYRNRFGHPHPEILARLQDTAQILRTDLLGAIEMRWSAGALQISHFWGSHRRYWHSVRH